MNVERAYLQGYHQNPSPNPHPQYSAPYGAYQVGVSHASQQIPSKTGIKLNMGNNYSFNDGTGFNVNPAGQVKRYK